MKEQVKQAMEGQRVAITKLDPWLEDYDHQKWEYVFEIEGVRNKNRIKG